ncbi:MAG: hypothetical protein JWN45_739 [Acidobacteriaceae bacterium]|nr:hypothetical protein [Acidobacteriaceae bacterium]
MLRQTIGFDKVLAGSQDKMKKTKEHTYEEAVAWLRDHGFDILEAPATPNRVFLKKYGCSAAIERADDGHAKLFAKPGYLINGEISRLIDKGFQKFLKTTKLEVPASADHLKAIHQFAEELREGVGAISLYNESLGTVSDRYVYDRVEDRDEPKPERPKRPWEKVKAKNSKKPA